MPSILNQLRSGDLSALGGARVWLDLPLREDLLNAMLAEVCAGNEGPLEQIVLAIHAQNRVHVQLSVRKWGFAKSFGFELEVERDMGFPDAPALRLSLPTAHAFMGTVIEILGAAFGFLSGGISVEGRTIVVDLAKMAPDDKAREMLRLVRRGEIETQQNLLMLRVSLEVDESVDTQEQVLV